MPTFSPVDECAVDLTRNCGTFLSSGEKTLSEDVEESSETRALSCICAGRQWQLLNNHCAVEDTKVLFIQDHFQLGRCCNAIISREEETLLHCIFIHYNHFLRAKQGFCSNRAKNCIFKMGKR